MLRGLSHHPGYEEYRELCHLIIGARSKDLIIMEDEMKAISDEIIVTTDGLSGSAVSQALESIS